MSIDTLERTRGFEGDLALHLAGQRVIQAGHMGGGGGFRVDGVTDSILAQLPEYVRSFEGGLFPKVFFDEDGQARVGGHAVVNEQDCSFRLERTWVDEESGEQKAWFRWDSPHWHEPLPEATEPLARTTPSQPPERRVYFDLIHPASRFLGIVALSAHMLGFGLIYAPRAEQPTPVQTEQNAEDGGKLIALGFLTGAAATLIEVSRLSSKNLTK